MRERTKSWAVVGAGLVLLLAGCDAGAGAPRGQSEPAIAPGEDSAAGEAGTAPAGSGDEAASSDGEAAGSDGEAAGSDGEAAGSDGEAAGSDGEAAGSDGEAAAETDEPEPTADEGSRENPFQIGDDVGNDDWGIVLDQPYEAWDEVQAENQFNDPPADGMEFWMLPVSVTYTGDETGDPFWDLDFGFVSEDGRTHDDDCGMVPDELMEVGEMYPDAEASANICLEVPEGAPGLWTVAATFTDPVFFTAEQD